MPITSCGSVINSDAIVFVLLARVPLSPLHSVKDWDIDTRIEAAVTVVVMRVFLQKGIQMC
jgi:hypothetical protein